MSTSCPATRSDLGDHHHQQEETTRHTSKFLLLQRILHEPFTRAREQQAAHETSYGREPQLTLETCCTSVTQTQRSLDYYNMFQGLSTAVDYDDNEPSSAPTTPNGSVTFSPVIQPARVNDAFEGMGSHITHTSRGSASSFEYIDGTSQVPIRNICCVGAGYVGKFCGNCHDHHLQFWTRSVEPTMARRISTPCALWQSHLERS